MSSSPSFVIAAVTLVVLLATTVVTVEAEANCNGNSTDTFDFFLLVNDWGPNTCIGFGDTCNKTFLTTGFALHGLWANRDDGSWPQYCPGPAYNPSLIQSIRPRMNLLWADLQDDQDEAFWNHEWSKHGVCASSVPQLSDQFLFFNSTLNLIAAHNYTQYLADAKIVASKDYYYYATDISNAIKAGIGATPIIQCSNDFLATVTACVSKDLQFIDCTPDTISCAQGANCDKVYIQTAEEAMEYLATLEK